MEFVDLKLVAPKFKLGDKVTYIQYERKITGIIREVNQNTKILNKGGNYSVTGNGWYYTVNVNGSLHCYIEEKRLSLYDEKQEWKDKLAERGITYDDKKVEPKSIYYDTRMNSFNGMPLMITGFPPANLEENITVIFKKK